MELDDLKQTWQQTPVETNKKTDIMELLQHDSYGPVAALKRVFRKQMLMMAFIPFLLFLTNINNVHMVLTSIMFWSYVVFCICVVAFAYNNYQIARKMEMMDGMVRTNLEQQINLLEKRKRWELMGLRGALIFFIALTEIVTYFQHYRMLELWHSFSPLIRYGIYVGLLLLQYFLNKKISQRNMGQHLDYLKELVKEMQ